MDVFTDSYLRANIIAWLPIKKNDFVCYIGNDTDTAAKKLKEMSDHVTCVSKTETPQKGRYEFLVCLGMASKEELQVYSSCLSESGKLVLAAENAYGLKYLAGAKETGSGEYFGSVEALKEADGVTREEIITRLSDAGFMWQTFYYPFPDYYFAMSIYSDDYLPKPGELIDQIGNFDAERLVLFDESKAMDAVIARGRFFEFSNSYLVIAGSKTSACCTNERGETISFVKFSNDRGKQHNICTLVTKSADKRFHLLKTAYGKEALPQIENLKQSYHALKELYEGTKISVNAYRERECGIELEFLNGHTLEEELDLLLEQGKLETAYLKMSDVFEVIRSCKHQKEFEMTEEFCRVFGNRKLPSGLKAAPVCDIDFIMPNILVGADGGWTLIDYEWSFQFPVPLNFIIYRNIRYYADTTAARRVLNPQALYEKAKISAQEIVEYAAMEEAFQAYVLDGHTPLRQLYREQGKPAYHVSSVLHVIDDMERRRALMVYFDRGGGFSEKDTETYHSKAMDGTYHLEIPVGAEVKKLRIDPGSQACTVDIERMSWKGSRNTVLNFISNGHKMSGSMYLFDTEDPNILLENLPQKDKTLLLDLRIDSMSLSAAEWIAPKIDTKYKLKKMLKK